MALLNLVLNVLRLGHVEKIVGSNADCDDSSDNNNDIEGGEQFLLGLLLEGGCLCLT